jgi:hypothetical protein
MGEGPLIESLADAARQCLDYAEDGSPPTDTLIVWSELFDAAAARLTGWEASVG